MNLYRSVSSVLEMLLGFQKKVVGENSTLKKSQSRVPPKILSQVQVQQSGLQCLRTCQAIKINPKPDSSWKGLSSRSWRWGGGRQSSPSQEEERPLRHLSRGLYQTPLPVMSVPLFPRGRREAGAAGSLGRACPMKQEAFAQEPGATAGLLPRPLHLR